MILLSVDLPSKHLLLGGAAILVLGVALQRAFSRRDARRRKRLPPGPRGSFLLGVTSEMLDQSVKPWLRFEKWSKEYAANDLLYVPTLGLDSIVVNSFQAAMDLLEKRPKIYSGRPRNVFDAEIVEGSMVLANIDEPDAVSRRRKLLNEDLGPQGCRQVQPIQTQEARRFCAALTRRPDGYIDCINESAHILVRRMTYGLITSMTPAQLWAHVEHTQNRPKPGLYPFLLIFPSLRYLPDWFPGAGFWKTGRKYHEEDRKVWLDLMADMKRIQNEPTTPFSFATKWLQSDAGRRHGLDETQLAFAAGNLITAGGDLPEVTLKIFIAVMLHFPEICAQAQTEIDKVVGRERLPSFVDKESLPFTRAVILETQRWRPLTPIGVCHVATEDDEYKGMFIPKGTRFYPSLWALSRDPSVYSDPDRFNPTRFLRGDGSFTKHNELPTWGFGGRKCSAMHLAEATLFINIATLLWSFDFVAPINESTGERIIPSMDWQEWEDVIPCSPPRFAVTCKVRGPEVATMLEAELEDIPS